MWNIRQASLLIDSFMMGLPVPPVFLYLAEDNKYLVIDGQQRLLSIFFFFEGYFGQEEHGKRKVFKLTGLDDSIADVCFLRLLLHEVEQPEKVLAEAYRLLKPGSKTVALEWRYEPDTQGPPQSERISKDEIEQLFNQAGYLNRRYKEWTESLYLFTSSKDKLA